MDPKTLAYYETFGEQLALRYETVPSPVSQFFRVAFPEGVRILDVGAGSGRDLAALSAAGYDAFGVEPSSTFREAAFATHPELAGRIVDGSLPHIGTPHGGNFEGILCSAVLMHLGEADLFDAAFALRGLLKKGGRLLLSLPRNRTDILADGRDSNGRLFAPYTSEYVQLLFERLGFQLIGRWDTEDALCRPGTGWFTLLLELGTGDKLRAVDQIEGILNRDRKVATYKLALFRALAEMATQQPRVATWRSDGRVAVPLLGIAERWLLYYWPIFASDRFIPQSQDEGLREDRQIAFRSALEGLMRAFQDQGEHGGLSSWQAAVSRGGLPAEVRRAHAAALSAIAQAIRSGPVKHSGGSLETGAVFSYDKSSRSVVMPAEMWRELTLLGHWIVDAVIVRWAALTERFAGRGGVSSGEVLPLLLARPSSERMTNLARSVFRKTGVDRCTWSGRPLHVMSFDVDHVIPFALWANNDLWNLVPADPRVNMQKSDLLPATELMLARRGEILRHWDILRDEMSEAFDADAVHLLGRKPGGYLAWRDELFGCLRQAVEITALQRGVERWSPSGFESR
ncbi:MAG: methyltransferase domain-containing protein [Comamonadaceae bacterium]|nr:MAG: methyltransferase domain-containing protein [Comamonadaceae bacterium]